MKKSTFCKWAKGIFSLFCFLSLQAQNPYPNFDFSEKNFTGWKLYRGSQSGDGSDRVINYLDISTTDNSVPFNTMQFIYPPSNPRARLEDPNTCYDILRIPKNKEFSMRIGPLSPGGYGSPQGYKAAYTLHVVPERATLVYRFAFVQQYDHGSSGGDPFGFGGDGTPSGPGNNALFWVQLLNDNSEQIGGTCANYRLFPGMGTEVEWFRWNKCGEISSTPWMTDVIDLTPYIGEDIIIEFNTMDCYTGHHMAYAYISPETFTSDTVSYYCPGNDTAYIEAPLGFRTYEWRTLDGSFYTLKENAEKIGVDIEGVNMLAVPNPVAGAKYECTFTSYSGCSDTVVYEMLPDSVHADFLVDIIEEKCRTVAFEDTAYTTYETPILAYYYNFGETDEILEQRNPEYAFSSYGNHEVQLVAVSERGCADTVKKTIELIQPITLDFDMVSGICEKEILTLTNTTTGNYQTSQWHFGDGNSNTGHEVNHAYTQAGNYKVQLQVVYDECIDSLEKEISVYPKPQLRYADQQICSGETVDLSSQQVLFSTADQVIKWHYNFGDGSSSVEQSQSLVAYRYTFDGIFMLTTTAISSQGCADTLLSTVEVSPVPQVSFSQSQNADCVPLCVQFTDLSSVKYGAIANYYWNFGNGNSHEKDPSHCYTTHGAYLVSLTVETEKRCVGQYTSETPISVYPLPTADFEVNHNRKEITFSNKSKGANQFHWDFGDGNISQEKEQIHTYEYSGEYEVSLIVVSEFPCFDTLVRFVVVDSIFNVVIPNAFSPNGDGIHDVFIIQNIEHFPDAELKIFNQWGELIYTANATSNMQWDGTRNGHALPVSAYYYILHLHDKEERKFNGHITLIK